MAQDFDSINAPQFFYFTMNNSEDVDDMDMDNYFVFNHEPEEDPLQLEEKVNGDKDFRTSNIRRSMSVTDIHYLETALKNTDILTFEVKANSSNNKLLHGPVNLVVMEKPADVPEQFNFTSISQKKIKKITEFNEIPQPAADKNKSALAHPPSRIPISESSSLMRRYTKESPKRFAQSKEKSKNAIVKNPRTQVLPFSFEVRNQQIKKKRENLMKRVLEEERKAREFRAKPIPKSVLQQSKNVNLPKNLSQKSLDRATSNDNISIRFKARPATVLQKRPFIPKPLERSMPTFSEFELRTEQRIEGRKLFKRYLMEKEEQKIITRQMEELKLKLAEAAEIAKQRKMAEHKAQPIRRYKEVHIEPVRQLTEPISPKFHSKRHRNTYTNKENLANG